MNENQLMILFIILSSITTTLLVIINRIKKCKSLCFTCELEPVSQHEQQNNTTPTIDYNVINRLFKTLTPRRFRRSELGRRQNENTSQPRDDVEMSTPDRRSP